MLRVLLLLVGLVLLAWVVVAQGPREILGLLLRVGWGSVPVAIVYGVYQAVRAAALWRCLPPSSALGYWQTLWIRVSGEAVQFLTATGPVIAEPTKAWLLSRRGLTRAEGFAATIAEYLVNMLVAALMLAGSALYMLARLDLGPALQTMARVLAAVSVAFVLVAVVAIWRRIYLIGGVLRGIGALPGVGPRLRLDPAAVRRFEDRLLAVVRDDPGRLSLIVLLEAVAHALLVVELAWILSLSGLTFSLGRALLVEGVTKFVSPAFFFLPGQIGAAEGVLAVVVGTLGLPGSIGVAAMIVRRVRSAIVSAVGLAALALLIRQRVSKVEADL
jgi:hypothetical protein